MKKIPRILLAAVSSNSGKTAAACGMMSAYVQQGLNIRSCKKRQWKDNHHMCFFKTVIMQEKTSGVL